MGGDDPEAEPLALLDRAQPRDLESDARAIGVWPIAIACAGLIPL